MALKTSKNYKVVGKAITRLDTSDKVRGRTQYVDDVPLSDGWFGAILRSPVSRGRLKGLQFDDAFDWSRVVVVTPEDIPGENIVDLMGRDMPFIAFDEIQYLGEPLALVAAPTRRMADEAIEAMQADVAKLDPIETLDEVVDLYKTDRDQLKQLWSQTIVKGDVENALAASDHVVEGEYFCGHQEQLYIEPQGMIAIPEKDGGYFIQGSMQCPYYINPELCITLDVPPEKLRVKQTVVGGAFGGKEEFPTLLAGYCALLARKANKPVKMIYDRHQDILYTTKRHPAWIRHRAGVNKDGTITALHIEFLIDGGAYTTLSPVVMYRGILHAAMGYRCENVFVDGYVYQTNTFPNGAFRGFGAPQSLWGLESHIDELAHAIGMAPHEFRLQNCLVKGDITPTGQVLKDSVGSPDVLIETLKRSGFESKYQHCSHGKPDERTWYGIGVSFFAHGAGFTGDGEARIKAKVALDLEILENGKPGVNVRASSTEMGQGTQTILAQTSAEGLGVSFEHVRCPYPDTKLVPDSGPTVASRTAMVVGSTTYTAGQKMKLQLEAYVSEELMDGHEVSLADSVFTRGFDEKTIPFEEAAGHYITNRGPLRVYDNFDLPPDIKWNQETFVGDAYPSYSWACNVAEVEIDTLTFEIKVTDIHAIFDIGKVINPLLAKGQIEGGLIQALGYAVMEKIDVKDGRYDADRMQTYVIPTMVDLPRMHLDFLEFPYDAAKPGAKGVGEIPMDGMAPAVANAVQAASGIRLNRIPVSPEALFEALREKEGIVK